LFFAGDKRDSSVLASSIEQKDVIDSRQDLLTTGVESSFVSYGTYEMSKR
jgi:hypothetical protein